MAQDRFETTKASRLGSASSGRLDTIAAIGTPLAAAALGFVRLSGPDALKIGHKFLRPSEGGFAPRRATFARAVDERGEPLDQAVAVYYPAAESPTGEDLLEISAHGSPYIVNRLLETACGHGARAAKPGEFTQRAFLNGRMDLSQAEAVCELIRSRTETAHRAALSQLEGGISGAVRKIREPLFDLLVRVEAALDHPEEDIPSIPEEEAGAVLVESRGAIERLKNSYEQGRLYCEGARVSLVGRPNAGKSSLLNALLGYERAIVCPTPGTTRDTLEERSSIRGIPSVLVDTAGLREGSLDPAEEEGMRRAREAIGGSDVVLLVVDGSRPLDPEDERVHRDVFEEAERTRKPLLTVLNKIDLCSTDRRDAHVKVSALRREGLDRLLDSISHRLFEKQGENGQGLVVTSPRHRQALAAAQAETAEALDALARFPGRWEERVAFHLRETLRFLGEILGEGSPEDVIAAVFARFCVGK